jgi:hypothetical protein
LVKGKRRKQAQGCRDPDNPEGEQVGRAFCPKEESLWAWMVEEEVVVVG